MVIYKYKGKDIYIFDNHNHAFYFWIKSKKKRNLHPGKTKTTFQPFKTIDFVIGYNRKTRVFEEHYGMSVIALRKQRKIILHTIL